MSTQRATSGGVKSLRAMFESSKSESQPGSPEMRGRSPAESARSSESNPRPSSKIRASFVPVEPPVFADDAVEDEPLDPQATNAQAQEHESTIAQRRGSFSLDAQRDSEVLDELKSSVSEEREQRRQSVDIQETIPEQAVMTGPTNTPFPEIKEEDAMGMFVNNQANKLQDPKLSNSAGPMQEATQENADNAVREAARSLEQVEQDTGRKSEPVEAEPAPQQDLAIHSTEQHSNQPDKVVSAVEDNDAIMKPADPKEESTVSGGRALPNPHEQLLSLAGKPTQKPAEPAQPPAEPAQPPAEPAQPPAEPAQPPAAEEPVPEPAEEPAKPTLEPSPLIESSADKANGAAEPEQELAAEPAEAKPALSETNVEKSPVASKTPTSVASPAKSASSKTASKEPAKKASRTSLHSQTSTSAPVPKARSTSRPAADRKPVHPSPVSKPKPKSPTRPTKVPSHLMAPTAASAAKREADKAAAEKAAAPRKTTTTPRAPSVASKTTAASSTKTAKPAAGRASLDSASRPTAASVSKRPESRTSASGGRRTSAAPKAADEGFLARMMRPTAASASKTHDKKEPEVKSPPRRTVSNPTRKPNGTSLAERGKKAVQKVVPGAGKKEEVKHEEPEHKSEPEPEPQPEAAPAAEEPAPAAEEEAAAPEPEPEHHPEPIPEEPAAETSEPPKDVITTEEGQSAPNEELTQTPAGMNAANEIH
ncbi:uncharacterized protein K452DRAFT_44404 [Aplosporella prunicola CBS 121167]|uniref:Uncharacterized protein n=1 Tax=Aplosporella prunicola CBS 121167 TaxID=1176127 RepID=A0A6A6BBR4_9PEZI|nr:uncharacterized protein K452DRAFT_44404 [Aplosporella prunicola CBS 121167]KAF2141048.1 hypothetical protein K452DRAFT_44404 [Aplosporella prunicola CBS 121167]